MGNKAKKENCSITKLNQHLLEAKKRNDNKTAKLIQKCIERIKHKGLQNE